VESENLWITLCATGLQGGGELCVREFGQQQEQPPGEGDLAPLGQYPLASSLLAGAAGIGGNDLPAAPLGKARRCQAGNVAL
jgi:hypothetical protein